MPSQPQPPRPTVDFDRAAYPYHERLGVEIEESSGGKSRIRMEVAERHLRSGGIVHGGVLATLIDIATGVAARSVAPPEADLVTIQLNVNFVRATGVGDTLVGTADVEHAGRRSVVAHAEIRNAAGKLVAIGSGTLLYVP